MMDQNKAMNCPKCEASISEGQNYCRDCGAELIAQRPNRVRIAGVVVLGLMFAGLLVAMGGKMFDMRWLAYLGLVVMMTCAFIMAAYAFLRETRPRKRAPRSVEAPLAVLTVEKADTTNKLLPVGDNDYLPSVVENTTNLLETRPNS